MVWLVVMSLFPLSSLLLKFNRGRLDRQPHTPLSIVFLTFVVAAVVMAGNIVIDPSTVGCVPFPFSFASLSLKTLDSWIGMRRRTLLVSWRFFP